MSSSAPKRTPEGDRPKEPATEAAAALDALRESASEAHRDLEQRSSGSLVPSGSAVSKSSCATESSDGSRDGGSSLAGSGDSGGAAADRQSGSALLSAALTTGGTAKPTARRSSVDLRGASAERPAAVAGAAATISAGAGRSPAGTTGQSPAAGGRSPAGLRAPASGQGLPASRSDVVRSLTAVTSLPLDHGDVIVGGDWVKDLIEDDEEDRAAALPPRHPSALLRRYASRPTPAAASGFSPAAAAGASGSASGETFPETELADAAHLRPGRGGSVGAAGTAARRLDTSLGPGMGLLQQPLVSPPASGTAAETAPMLRWADDAGAAAAAAGPAGMIAGLGARKGTGMGMGMGLGAGVGAGRGGGGAGVMGSSSSPRESDFTEADLDAALALGEASPREGGSDLSALEAGARGVFKKDKSKPDARDEAKGVGERSGKKQPLMEGVELASPRDVDMGLGMGMGMGERGEGGRGRARGDKVEGDGEGEGVSVAAAAPAHGGALQAGGMADLWTRDHIGVAFNYFCVGLLTGASSAMMYPVFSFILGMSSYTVKGGYQVMTVWWVFKVFIGAVSDTKPLWGLRRKPYIIAGWTMACVLLLILATFGQPQRGDEPYMYLLMLSGVTFFFIWGDVAMDSYLTDLAQREPQHLRGSLQSTIYMIRYVATAAIGSIMAFAFSSPEYGGTFAHSLQFPHLIIILLVCCAAGLYPYFRLKEEGTHTTLPYFGQFRKLFERLKLNAVWRVILFSFLVHFFAYFSNAASYDVARQWCHVEPWTEGLFGNVLASLIVASGVWATKRFFINTSWRKLLFITIIGIAVLSYIPAVLIDLGYIRSQFFYVGAPLANQFIFGIFFIVCTYCAVEVAEKGSEGITFGLITTVGNLSIPFTNVLSANISALFHLYLPDRKTLDDSHEGRKQMFWLDTVVFLLQLCALPTLLILPAQKDHVQRLIASGRKNAFMAWFVVIGLGFCLVWSVMGNFMQIFPQTACLRLVGGRGCGTAAKA